VLRFEEPRAILFGVVQNTQRFKRVLQNAAPEQRHSYQERQKHWSVFVARL